MNQSDNSRYHPPVPESPVELTTSAPVGDRLFTIAPKHMASPVERQKCYEFACTPHNSTYKNIFRNGIFAVTYPTTSQWLQTNLTASPVYDTGSKPSLNLVQKQCALRILNLLRRSTEVELNRIFDDLLFSQTANT